MAYADVSDLEARWRELSNAEQERAEVLLEDASAVLDSLVDVDETDTEQLELCKIVVCAMVQRAMVVGEADAYGVTQQSMTSGPYTHSWTYSNPNANLYLTKAEKKMLGIGGGYIGSIRPMIGGNHDNWH